MTGTVSFEPARLDAAVLLAQAQDLLVASQDHGVVARRARQDALSYISAARQALLKAEPLVTDYHAGAGKEYTL